MTERRRLNRQRRRLRVALGKVAVFTSDVSEGGFCAELMHVLEPGHAVSGTVAVGSHEYPFLGKVAWARAGDPRLGQRGRMGVRFESIDDHFLAAYHSAFPPPH
ncbi:MAG: PilZ domain-containing protein [Myxococcaceae bacterium]